MRIKLFSIFAIALALCAVTPTGSVADTAHSIQNQTSYQHGGKTFLADFQVIQSVHADEPAPALSPAPGPALTVPSADIAQVLLNLATNYKTLGVLGVLMLLTLLSVQAIKSFVPDDWKWKRMTVVVVSILYSVLSGVFVPGSNAASVVITVFLTGGGASALYEALKGVGVIKSS